MCQTQIWLHKSPAQSKQSATTLSNYSENRSDVIVQLKLYNSLDRYMCVYDMFGSKNNGIERCCAKYEQV